MSKCNLFLVQGFDKDHCKCCYLSRVLILGYYARYLGLCSYKYNEKCFTEKDIQSISNTSK